MSDNETRDTPENKLRRFRAPEDLWNDFADAVERGPDAEADRSKVLRQFIRWYAGYPDAELPRRPATRQP